ncbi:MAG: NAD-dependent DNA ligase LigA [Oligoflexia bacterium]|nr:NAD-dependent DNA ligase LigA [Oligoflexia bacterium]
MKAFYKLNQELDKFILSFGPKAKFSKAKELWEKATELMSSLDMSYYSDDAPLISDTDYDLFVKKIEKLEDLYPDLRRDSPTQRVSGTASSSFNKVAHKTPMLSLANTYNAEELLDFNLRVLKFLDWPKDKEIGYLVEPKLDGLAIEVIFEDGHLVRALTRGDGTTGEDVTENVKTIKTLPHKLKTLKTPKLLELRGEILLFKEDFLELNKQQEEDGEATFANPRNAAAGSIRQLDPAITAARPLKIFFYGFGEIDGVNFKTHQEFEEKLLSYGLPVNNQAQICKNIDDVVKYYKKLESKRHELDYDIDGVVVKINDLSLQKTLGTIAKSPRWATAAKFKPEQAQTVVEKIDVQVGRTGALTPVAIMKPVKVGGVTITHATLHNQDEVDRKDVRQGDHVIIQRAGDVIPEIVSVVFEKRAKNSKPFKIPLICPSCQSVAKKPAGEAVLRCLNPLCPAKIKEGLKHFVSRRAMNVEKLGDKLIEQLVDLKLVFKFSDIYRLSHKDLEKLPRQGEKSIQNLLDSIEKSKNSSLSRLIYACGIRFVGEQTAKILARQFETLDGFLNASEEALLNAHEVGEKVAKSILEQIKNPLFKKELHEIVRLGVILKTEAQNKKQGSQKLSGLSFVVTGTLEGLSRDEAKDLIELHGGTVQSSVSKKTNYLLCGESPGSKLDKAQALEVKVIDLKEFMEFIKN